MRSAVRGAILALVLMFLASAFALVGCGPQVTQPPADKGVASRIQYLLDPKGDYDGRVEVAAELSRESTEAVTAMVDALDESGDAVTTAILLEAVASTDSTQAVPTLRKYLSDPDLAGAAAILLGQRGDASGRQTLVDIAEGRRKDRFVAASEAADVAAKLRGAVKQ